MARVPDGVDDRGALTVVARRVLLDGLEALVGQAGAVTVVGAQAVYLRSPRLVDDVATSRQAAIRRSQDDLGSTHRRQRLRRPSRRSRCSAFVFETHYPTGTGSLRTVARC